MEHTPSARCGLSQTASQGEQVLVMRDEENNRTLKKSREKRKPYNARVLCEELSLWLIKCSRWLLDNYLLAQTKLVKLSLHDILLPTALNLLY